MNSKVDTHVHTYFSGVSNYKVLRFPESITKPETQVECARKHGMNVLCITDHDAVKGAFEAQKYAKQYDDIEVIVGEEVTSADGEVPAYWLNGNYAPYTKHGRPSCIPFRY
ncbi:MAG: PHP domain-containing protein [Candidatus Methanomethylophilaceae archaeon]|nr:PHP domain-containing protein [Candidatus Methanomethylophilaceae archaeon]